MKKYLFLCSFLALAFAGFAQDAVLLPLAAGDTIVNTGTSTKIFNTTAGQSGLYLQVVFNKISGTAAGTMQLSGSLDGTNYVNIGSAYTITNVTAQSTVISIVTPVPKYLKFLSTGSGTEAVQVRYYYRSPKYQAP